MKNERGTGKFQPVGGVYKLLNSEKLGKIVFNIERVSKKFSFVANST